MWAGQLVFPNVRVLKALTQGNLLRSTKLFPQPAILRNPKPVEGLEEECDHHIDSPVADVSPCLFLCSCALCRPVRPCAHAPLPVAVCSHLDLPFFHSIV